MTLQQIYCTHNNNRIKTPLVHIASYYHLAWVDKSTLKTPFYVPPKKKKKKKKNPFLLLKKKKTSVNPHIPTFAEKNGDL